MALSLTRMAFLSLLSSVNSCFIGTDKYSRNQIYCCKIASIEIQNLVGGDKDDKEVEDRDGGGPRADPEGDPNHVLRPPPPHHPHLRRQVAENNFL